MAAGWGRPNWPSRLVEYLATTGMTYPYPTVPTAPCPEIPRTATNARTVDFQLLHGMSNEQEHGGFHRSVIVGLVPPKFERPWQGHGRLQGASKVSDRPRSCKRKERKKGSTVDGFSCRVRGVASSRRGRGTLEAWLLRGGEGAQGFVILKLSNHSTATRTRSHHHVRREPETQGGMQVWIEQVKDGGLQALVLTCILNPPRIMHIRQLDYSIDICVRTRAACICLTVSLSWAQKAIEQIVSSTAGNVR